MTSKFFRELPPWKVYILLTLVVQGLGQHEAKKVLVNGRLGKAVRLTPSSLFRPDVEIKWWKENVIVCQRTSIKECNPKFGHRFTLDLANLTMKIKSLQSADAGLYRFTVGKELDIENEEYFELKLYDAVSQPVISVQNVTFNETCLVTLSCLTQNGTDVHYTWTQEERALVTNGNGYTSSVHEQMLELNITSPSAVNYSCTATNPVSNLTTTIYLQNICVFKFTEKESVGNKPVLELVHILFVAMAIFLLILIVTVFILLVCRSKKKAEQSVELPHQSLTVYAEISTPRQPSQVAKASSGPQSNTVYAMVTRPQCVRQ